MRSILGFGTVIVFLGILVGCSSNPPPIRVAEKVGGEGDSPKTQDVPELQKPEKSDPASVAVIEAAVKAHTGGKPELLQSFKSVTASREGLGVSMTIDRVFQKWNFQMVWPDKIRIRVELPNNNNDYSILTMSGETIWSAGTNNREKQVAEPKLAASVIVDMSAEWYLMLFPLTESTTVFAPAPDGLPNLKPATGVRVWAKGIAEAVLYFDKETKLLSQIRFDGREGNQKVTKDVLIFGNKAFAGVLLPEKIEVRSNGRYLFDWTQTVLEPTTTINPKVFENP